jgi:RNA polymerase sigma factor (sigma-70 family)
MNQKDTWTLDKNAEDQLIRLAAQGDEPACLKLWSLYHGLLVNETHRHLRGNPEQLEEERSLSSLAFMQAVHDYDPGRNIHFAAFLQQRIRMTLYNAFRQRREDWTHTCHPDADTDGQDFWENHGGTTADTASPEAIVSRQLLLRTLIHCLPAREKQLIVLLYLLDLPQCEAAARLDITHQAVTRLKQRTLQQLRRNMENTTRP